MKFKVQRVLSLVLCVAALSTRAGETETSEALEFKRGLFDINLSESRHAKLTSHQVLDEQLKMFVLQSTMTLVDEASRAQSEVYGTAEIRRAVDIVSGILEKRHLLGALSAVVAQCVPDQSWKDVATREGAILLSALAPGLANVLEPESTEILRSKIEAHVFELRQRIGARKKSVPVSAANSDLDAEVNMEDVELLENVSYLEYYRAASEFLKFLTPTIATLDTPEAVHKREQTLTLLDEISTLLSNIGLKHAELQTKYLEGVRLGSELARLVGAANSADLLFKDSALAIFEQSKGRGDLPFNVFSSAVSKMLRAIYERAIVPTHGRSLDLNNFEKVFLRDMNSPTRATEQMTLRTALFGFGLVTKALLNLEISNDLEQDLWNKDSMALKVASAGNVLGRIFIDISADHSGVIHMSGIQCKTSSRGPAIVVVQLKGVSVSVDSYTTSREASKLNTNSVILTRRQVETLFHELAHALHCINGQYLTRFTSTMIGGPEDFLELPSHLFEYFARDWFDWNQNRKVDQRTCRDVNSSADIKASLIRSLLIQALYSDNGFDASKVLGPLADVIPPELITQFLPRLVASTAYHPWAHFFAHIMATMVYSAGGYREKLFSVFDEYPHEKAKNAWFPESIVDLELAVSLPGQQGIRSFFNSGAVNPTFASFFEIVPGLSKKFETAEYLEDAIDFRYLIEEMLLWG